MVCSGMKYAIHRSRPSLLQGYLYMAVYFGLEKPVRSASLNEIVDSPPKYTVLQCRHFVLYSEHGIISETQRSVCVSHSKFGGYYVLVYQICLLGLTYTVLSGVFYDSISLQ